MTHAVHTKALNEHMFSCSKTATYDERLEDVERKSDDCGAENTDHAGCLRAKRGRQHTLRMTQTNCSQSEDCEDSVTWYDLSNIRQGKAHVGEEGDRDGKGKGGCSARLRNASQSQLQASKILSELTESRFSIESIQKEEKLANRMTLGKLLEGFAFHT